jgi:hypothetical protein
MPNRVLRQAITRSEKIDKLTPEDEAFFYRLLVVVDDYGLMDARPCILRSEMFPLKDPTKLTNAHVEQCLRALESVRDGIDPHGLIRRYEVNGRPYLQVLQWEQRLRCQKPKYPQPPDPTGKGGNGGQPSAIGHTSGGRARARADARATLASVSFNKKVRGVQGGKEKLSTALPKGFAISDGVREWAAKHSYGQLGTHLEVFVRKARAHGYCYVDWDEAFMNAIAEDWAGLLKNGASIITQARVAEARERAAWNAAQLAVLREKRHDDNWSPDELHQRIEERLKQHPP